MPRGSTARTPDLDHEGWQRVFERDRRRCLRCGSREITRQHRRAIGMGGLGKKHPKLTCADGVTLCGRCNVGAEAELQSECLRLGWKIPRLCPVASREIPYYDMVAAQWWLPNDTGGRVAVDPGWAMDRIKAVTGR